MARFWRDLGTLNYLYSQTLKFTNLCLQVARRGGYAMGQRPDDPPTRAYMLRFWKVGSPAQLRPPTWRFSLQDPHTGERLGFADLASLISFLEAEMACDTPTDGQ
jgi:hypothetical protein